MGELDEKLNRILNDPDAVNQIMNMASAFGAGFPESEEAGGIPVPDPEMLSRIMRIVGELGRGADKNASLLYAIRPYLNPRRQAKLGDAITVMRLARILPHIKEGLL